MKHVDHATFIASHDADNETLHQEFNPAISLPGSLIELMEARYCEETADMVKHERSHILPQFKAWDTNESGIRRMR
jgi:hypothetical protein